MSRSKMRSKQQRDVTFLEDGATDDSPGEEDFASSVINRRINPDIEPLVSENRKRRVSDRHRHRTKENGGGVGGAWSSLMSGKDSANVKALLLMAFLAVVLVRMGQAMTQQGGGVDNTASMLRSSAQQQQQQQQQSAVMTYPPPGYTNQQLPPGYYFYPGTAATVGQQQIPLNGAQGGAVPQTTTLVQHVDNAVSLVNQQQLLQQQQQQQQQQANTVPIGISTSGVKVQSDSSGTVATSATTTAESGLAGSSLSVTVPKLDGGTLDAARSIPVEASATQSSVTQSAPVTAEDILGSTTTTPAETSTTTPPAEEQPVQTNTADASQELPPTIEGVVVKEEDSLPQLAMFKDSWDPYEPSDVPVFWHIPKAGGSTCKDVVGSCHRKIMATEFGVTDGHDKDTTIAVVYPKGGEQGKDRSPFVNVDTTTVAGIERAKMMGFADSGLADMVVTPFIYEANGLFTPTARGRLFSVFRHPIDRAISMFYYIQVATWEPTYKPELQSWTLEQYATSDIVENNWMTRQLANVPGGDLTEEHLKVAMDVIRRKFLVGLMTKLEDTMSRFEKFFRWTYYVNPTNQEKCRERLVSGGSNRNSKNKKDKPKPGSNAWDLLAHQNLFDLQLYEYIETLFVEQEAFVAHLPNDFRMINSTCCKCDPPTYPEGGFTCPKAVLN